MSDISDLFELDPLSLTRDNIDQMIDHFRKARAQFNLGVKDAGKVPKGPKKTTIELDLDELLGGKP